MQQEMIKFYGGAVDTLIFYYSTPSWSLENFAQSVYVSYDDHSVAACQKSVHLTLRCLE